MLPVLKPDDEVLVNPRRPICQGDIVVAQHPYKTDVTLVKQVMGFDEAGRVRLQGINPHESTDSRTLGSLAPDLIIGPVTSRFHDPE